MKIDIRNNFRTPVIQITIGDKLSEKFDCLIDTGFTGALAGFIYQDQTGVKHSSINDIDCIQNPAPLPESTWAVLANGSKTETWKGKVLCNFNQIYRVSEIILISVAKPQTIPLILGMSLLKAYKANLSIHFASNKFDLEI